MMNRNDFELAVIALLGANLIALFIVGSVLLQEICRRPRIVGIIDGGRARGIDSSSRGPYRPKPEKSGLVEE
jgi:hypothetical protein